MYQLKICNRGPYWVVSVRIKKRTGEEKRKIETIRKKETEHFRGSIDDFITKNNAQQYVQLLRR